ncbi:MAG: NAD-dependent epimerase/dehydratase family protein [Candidatus Methanoperedens sp.]|nr:NAD-dependent epimerase/dehydratase family protein [Candidatus Methanoperedens sp.]
MILVTGGTGFVGSHLVRRLAQERIQTRCPVRRIADLKEMQEVFNLELVPLRKA